MGMFLSFLGGAAEGLTSEIEKSEKEAKAYASMATKALYENYGRTLEANRKLESEMKSDKDFIIANKPNATPDQVQALLSNPEVMKKYRAYANPTDVDLDTLVKITKSNPSVAVAAENVGAFEGIKDKAKETINTIQKTRGRTGLGGMIDSIAERSGNTAAVQTANALGVSLEELQRTKLKGRPTSDATFDMTVFKTPEEFKDAKDKAQMQLLAAIDTKDPTKIAQAEQNIARVTYVEERSKLTKKSEAEIQSDLVNEIQNKQANGDKQGAAVATSLLQQRKTLLKTPKDDGKTDADKISQANLIQTATRTRATTIEQTLPPGQLITSTDATGNVTISLRDLSQGALFKRGDAIASNTIIKEMTTPDGKPRSEMHKNAMMSAGIRFDDAGKAIKPDIPPAPTTSPKPTSTRGGPAVPVTPIPVEPAPVVAPAPARQPTQTPATAPRAVPKWNPKTNAWE